jgi:hypothetical protein
MKKPWLGERNVDNLNFSLRKKYRFVLTGGVGNQLFGYFAALAFKSVRKEPLVIDLSEITKGMTNHGSTLESFILDPDLRIKRKHWIPLTILTPLRKLFRFIGLSFEFKPTEVGFITNFFTIKQKRIVAYFQTWRYFDLLAASAETPKLTLRNPSNWYTSKAELALKEKPIMIHVRRGDYLKLQESIGVLKDSYFVSAYRKLPKEDQKRKIWIFTDSEKLIDGILLDKAFTNAEIVIPPRGTDPAESLMLMTFAGANIISNSTFSWWGAFLNQSNGPVVSPKKWFKGLDDPQDLAPPDWILCESEWL